MEFWTIFICNLFVPFVMVISGYFMRKHPPKNINGICGYRTKRSMQNEDTWAFAHRVCGKLWLIVGLILLVLTAAFTFLFKSAVVETLGTLCTVLVAVQTAILLITICLVETALKKYFDENGKRK